MLFVQSFISCSLLSVGCFVEDLYQRVIKANQTDNSERRMLKLKKLLHELPEINFETFHFLARHLAIVAGKEEVNKVSDVSAEHHFHTCSDGKSTKSKFCQFSDVFVRYGSF